MHEPKLIAVDMDGTLLGSDGRVSERNLAALRLAHERGAEVVIATGRRHSYAMRVLRGLGLDKDNALISSNGTVIRTVGAELLHRRHMPNRTARWLCEHVREFRSTLVLTFDTVQPDGEDVRGAMLCEDMTDLHTSVGRWMKANEPYIQHVPSLAEALNGDIADSRAPGLEPGLELIQTPIQKPILEPIQAMLCGSIERMREAEAHLLTHPAVTAVGAETHTGAEITLHRTVYPDRDLCILDILPAGCSKASALEELTATRGLSMNDVLALGDNWNDLPMLRLAGRAVLMSNAPEELQGMARECGWTMAPSNDEDGVAVVLEQVFA